MSYALVVAEVRRGVFEERNLDSFGISALLGKEVCLLVPDELLGDGEKFASTIVKVKAGEEVFSNPLNLKGIVEQVMTAKGRPDCIVFTHSSSGLECAAYLAGALGFPLITDVSAFDKEQHTFLKSYYSDKVFGQFECKGENPFILTVRSSSFKESAVEKGGAAVEAIENVAVTEDRTFIEYVEEEKADVDITKADFLLSIGRGVGNRDEIQDYEELARVLKAVLSGSRPVIDKAWLPKARQVGSSGKTVKPKVYLAMGISGAFQHMAGMKDSECIIAVNKDPDAPIFQSAHFGFIGDIHKVRDKLKEIVKG
jgi:electron transfer flavoprotein alpha subunit